MTPAKIMSIAPTAAAVEFTALSAIAADGCKVRPRRNADVDRARTRCADMENVMDYLRKDAKIIAEAALDLSEKAIAYRDKLNDAMQSLFVIEGLLRPHQGKPTLEGDAYKVADAALAKLQAKP